jgi:hypothetical protein
MTDTPDPTVIVPASLVKSGFPFQTAVADMVVRTPGWILAAQEFPWRDDLGKDHFLDVVAESSSTGVRLTIEAKKTDKEIYTFLRPDAARPLVRDKECRARVLHLRELTTAWETDVGRLEVYCEEGEIRPDSVESAFCVVSTSMSGGNSRLLERDAQLLIRGTDAYAFREKRRYVFKQSAPRMTHVEPIVPVIVTNAPLFVARYEPSKVSLETGAFSEIPPHTPVNVVRFRKAFLSHAEHDLGDRTVLVVNAEGLAEVLRELAASQGSHRSSRAPYPSPHS